MFGLFEAIGEAVLAIFGLWNRLTAPKTADAQRADDLEQSLKVVNAEAEASANAPTKMQELIEEQREGRI